LSVTDRDNHSSRVVPEGKVKRSGPTEQR
jgi:hypothetical protein